MESLVIKNFRSVHLVFTALFSLLVSLYAIPCLAQQDTAPQETQQATAQDKNTRPPFDVFNQPIDNLRIYLHLEKNAALQKERQAVDAAESLQRQLESANRNSGLSLDSLTSQPLARSKDLYQHMVKSCLYLGQFYDCGRCDRSHIAVSGGVLISESGLALTNYHVLEARPQGAGTTEGVIAMTHDGKCFEVEKILAADKSADVALVQLKANGHKFYAAPIAQTRPTPMAKANLVSHPSGEFFALTTGEVSRYSKVQRTKGQTVSPNAAWMEITADFGGGSSGCGVFNSTGEIIGVASRIRPLKRAGSKKIRNGEEVVQPPFVEMLVRRCTDLNAIHNCFTQPESDDSSTSSSNVREGTVEPK